MSSEKNVPLSIFFIKYLFCSVKLIMLKSVNSTIILTWFTITPSEFDSLYKKKKYNSPSKVNFPGFWNISKGFDDFEFCLRRRLDILLEENLFSSSKTSQFSLKLATLKFEFHAKHSGLKKYSSWKTTEIFLKIEFGCGASPKILIGDFDASLVFTIVK